MIDANFLKNLVKAADAAMPDYATPEQWNQAIEVIAKANRQTGEAVEQAYVRMIREDATCGRLNKMRVEALAKADRKRLGRPRKYTPQPASLSAAENELARQSLALAKAEQISFERAFVKVIDSPEGKKLFKETRT